MNFCYWFQIAIPKLYGQAHNLLKCCSNSISSGYSVTKGRYLYANRDIPVGSTVIVDQPFSSSINRDVLHSNCLHCYTCLNFDNSVIVPCTNCQSVSPFLFLCFTCFTIQHKLNLQEKILETQKTQLYTFKIKYIKIWDK